MRVILITNGSRGDVEPYVALGVEFTRAGHDAIVSAPSAFEAGVKDRGLGFAPTRVDVEEFSRELTEAGASFPRAIQKVRRLMKPLMKKMFEDYVRACKGADVVLYGANSYPGRLVARSMGIPTIATGLQPMFHSTKLYPSSVSETVLPLPFVPPAGALRAFYNLASYAATRQIFWQLLRSSVNEAAREVLRIGPEPLMGPYRKVVRSGEPLLNAWSRHVLPHPPDWPPQMHTTGYWFMAAPEGWQPPGVLRDFLENGASPVSVGFGSMTSQDPERLTEAVVKALGMSGRRGILLTGWGGISNADLPDDVIKVEEAPHDWLFERVCAAVHHGGAGTTAAALRAGVPTVTLPFFADQSFWGHRVAALGAGIQPIPARDVTARSLAKALASATDPGISRGAHEIGRKVRSEEGASAAALLIERYVDKERSAA